MKVLGLHGGVTIGQHDAGASVVIDGKPVAICEEERYTRHKSSYGMLPMYSVMAALDMAGIDYRDLDLVVAPGKTYADQMGRLALYLQHNFGSGPKLELVHHQEAHLASAFYASGYDSAACLSLDATGDGACAFLGIASREAGIEIVEEIPSSNSLGFFYTLMTHYLGFTDGDEYKVMGLAPYGKPDIDLSAIVGATDQGYHFDSRFLRASPPLKSPFEPIFSQDLVDLLRHGARSPGDSLSTFHKNVACSTQATFEQCLFSLVRHLRRRVTDQPNLCFAGGAALNCAANRRLLNEGIYEEIYVPPNAGDRGLSLGCAYMGAAILGDRPWPLGDAYLGSSYADSMIHEELTSNGCRFEEARDPDDAAAELLDQGKIIGWHQGRSEAGARALGNRSILASAAHVEMREKVNARIKYREEFRPFAPAVLYEDSANLFDTEGRESPFMCFAFQADQDHTEKMGAVVHVDGTSRLQTVKSSANPLFHQLLKAYKSRSGMGIVLNTSFNLKGQPIVETPRDALMTFYGCGLDALVVGPFVVVK